MAYGSISCVGVDVEVDVDVDLIMAVVVVVVVVERRGCHFCSVILSRSGHAR